MGSALLPEHRVNFLDPLPQIFNFYCLSKLTNSYQFMEISRFPNFPDVYQFFKNSPFCFPHFVAFSRLLQKCDDFSKIFTIFHNLSEFSWFLQMFHDFFKFTHFPKCIIFFFRFSRIFSIFSKLFRFFTIFHDFS